MECPLTSSLLSPHIFQSTLFSDTLSPYPSLIVTDQILHQSKQRAKTVVRFSVITLTDSCSEVHFNSLVRGT